MVASVVVLGLVGAVIASVAAGVPTGSLPGVALGSEVLLLAERTAALFATWMLIAVVVIRALKDQLPVEISGRGVTTGETMMARLNAMCRDNQDVEDRIFALLGEMKTPLEIVDILDLDRSDGEALVWRVIEERDTPNGIAIREGIERLAAIRI